MQKQNATGEKLVRWQGITVATLLTGYAGYYLCRSNLSVAGPLLIEQYGPEGFGKEELGLIASSGLAFYMLGKLFNGVLCDFLGGRRMFLFGMFGSAVCTVAFGLSAGTAMFVTIWSLNRLVQSMGWGALVKVASRWFPVHAHGTMMGVLCLSYLFGDTVSRLFLGQLLSFEFTWQQIFLVAAAVLGALALVSTLTLKSTPRDVGCEEPNANPRNIFGAAGEQPRPAGLRELLAPYARSASFWLICAVSFGLTLIRETFNFWTPVYLEEVVQIDAAAAATVSALVPLSGGLSVLVAGWATDRIGQGRRGVIMVPALLLLALPLFVLTQIPTQATWYLPVALICLTMFMMIGPYSFLTGVISLDFGGKQGASTAAGLVDAVGYGGALLSGYGVGRIAEDYGWTSAFTFLALVGIASGVAAFGFWYVHERGTPAVATEPASPTVSP